jgi:Protein of unknown function (DUF1579)
MATKSEEVIEKKESDCAMNVEPLKEHQWLTRLAGEWTCEGEATMGPGNPPVKWESTESVRHIGGVWIIAEGKGEMPGSGEPTTTLLTLGYDPQKKRYVGTFIGSMMTNMWVCDGALDASGTVLTLDTEGPNMAAPGKMAKYQDIIEIKSDDHRVLKSQMLGDDGKWTQVVMATYRRKK